MIKEVLFGVFILVLWVFFFYGIVSSIAQEGGLVLGTECRSGNGKSDILYLGKVGCN